MCALFLSSLTASVFFLAAGTDINLYWLQIRLERHQWFSVNGLFYLYFFLFPLIYFSINLFWFYKFLSLNNNAWLMLLFSVVLVFVKSCACSSVCTNVAWRCPRMKTKPVAILLFYWVTFLVRVVTHKAHRAPNSILRTSFKSWFSIVFGNQKL